MHVREQLPLGRRRLRRRRARLLDVDAEEPHRHDDDVAIAGRLKGGGDVGERVRIADRHQRIAAPRVHMVEREIARWQQLERVECFGRGGRDRARPREQQRRQDRQHERRGDGRNVALCDHRRSGGGCEEAGGIESERLIEAANPQIERGPEWARAGAAKSREGQHLDDDRRDDRDRVGVAEPRNLRAAGDDHDRCGGGRDVDRAGHRAEPRMRRADAFGQHVHRGQTAKCLLGVRERGARGGSQQDEGGERNQDRHPAAGPCRPSQCARDVDERRCARHDALGRDQPIHECEKPGAKRAGDDDEPGRALERADAWLWKLVRIAREPVAGADDRQGQTEPVEKSGERAQTKPAAGELGQRRKQRAHRRAGRHPNRRHDTPYQSGEQDAEAGPGAFRDPPRRHVATEPRADPEQAKKDDRDDERGVFNVDDGRESPAGNRHGHHARAVLAGHDRGQRRQQQPLDQDRRGRSCRHARAERAFRAADQSTWYECRPALDVDLAKVGAEDTCGEDEPRSGWPDARAGDTGDEEHRHGELGHGKAGNLRHGHQRLNARRRQDDADVPAGKAWKESRVSHAGRGWSISRARAWRS